MSKKDDEFLTPSTKKIRFRGDLNSHYFEHHIEDIFDDDRKKPKPTADEHPDKGKPSALYFVIVFVLCVYICVQMCQSQILHRKPRRKKLN